MTLQDIRYCWRALRQSPGFALTAILSMALAIGANSTVFSYADGLLLRPLPVPSPSEVVTLRSVSPSLSSLPLRGTGGMSYPDFKDFRNINRSFEGLSAYELIAVRFAVNADAPPEYVLGYQVSGNFFSALGIEPQFGRGFRPEEDAVPGRDAVVVLGHDLWKNEFGADPSVVGRRVRLNGLDFSVIGVTAQSFTGMDQFIRPAFFIPLMMGSKVDADADRLLTDRKRRGLVVKGRLKQGVSIQEAAQEAALLAQSLEQSYPDTNRGFSATVSTETAVRLINYPILGTLVSALFTITIVILGIASANIANLMLSRGRARAREIAVRLAIGSSRPRLIRLLLTECVLIAMVSGALALLVAYFAVGMFSAMEIPADVPIQLSFRLDERVLLFTLLVSAASVLLFGLVPVLQSTRPDLVSALKTGAAGGAAKRLLTTRALVIVQIAGSMVLLVSEMQGRRAFETALAANPGFQRERRITMRFNPWVAGYTPEQTQQFYERLMDRARQVSGIQSAALTSAAPMTFDFGIQPVVPEGYEFPPDTESVDVVSYVVDHHYFDTLRVPMILGRGFLVTDRVESPQVAVVNEAFAQKYLGSNPIGKHLRLDSREGRTVEVVGVTTTGKTISLIEPPVQVLYLPFSQNPRSRMTLVAETLGDPSGFAGSLRQMVQSIDPNLPVMSVRSLEDIFEKSTVSTIRMVGKIYKSATLLGLVLALVGLYAVISYQVARGTREIGIRIALGAERASVMMMFLRRAATMSVTGICIGMLLSLVAGRALGAGLGRAGNEPSLFILIAFGLLVTSLSAAAIPARRASQIDPQQALRQE